MRRIKETVFTLVVAIILPVLLTGCGDNNNEIGIGPVKSLSLGEIDSKLSEKGKELFESKCITCHRFDSKLIGPSLKDVTKRRKPEWIMNMILNPEQMTKENSEAKQLFGQYKTQMTFQNVSQDDARAILEYFRTNDK